MSTINIQSNFGSGSVASQTPLIGSIHYFPPTTTGLDINWIAEQGELVSRTTYAALWAWVQRTQTILSDEIWLTAQTNSPNGSVSYYSSGDGETTFRVPSSGTGAYRRIIGDGSEFSDDNRQKGVADATAKNGLSFTGTAVEGHTHSRGTMEIEGAMTGKYSALITAGQSEDEDYNTGSGALYNDGTSSTYIYQGGDSNRGSHLKFQASKNWTGSTSSAGGFTPSGTISGDSETRPVTIFGQTYIFTGAKIVYESAEDSDYEARIAELEDEVEASTKTYRKLITIDSEATITTDTTPTILLTRTGNVVTFYINAFIQSLGEGSTLTTLPTGYIPVTASCQSGVGSTSEMNTQYYYLGAGASKVKGYNIVGGGTRFECSGTWITSDDYPTGDEYTKAMQLADKISEANSDDTTRD